VDIKVLCAALKELHDLGVFHWVLQGGEPILDPPRLEAVLRGCYPEESYITVVSNGWAMTPERIRWLRELQVDKIAFSMDSGVPQEHDMGRRPGSHARVCAAVENVLAAGLLCSVSITVTHENLHTEGFTRALAFASARGIRVDVQVAEPVGRWDGQKEVLVRPEDAAYLKRLQRETPRLANGQWAVHRDLFCGDRDHCPAGTEFMALSSDGHVLPCNFLQYSMGRIGEMPIGKMREALLASRWFDGTHPVCICGEDHEFIDHHIVPYKDRPKPLDAYTTFQIDRPRNGHP